MRRRVPPPTKEELLSFNAAKKASVQSLEAELEELTKNLRYVVSVEIAQFKLTRNPDPSKTVRTRINLIKQYNECRDIAELLISILAEQKGTTTNHIKEDLGIEIFD